MRPRQPQRTLSPRESATLSFIQEFITRRQYAPTRREIGDGIGVSSTSVVQHYLKRLERGGYIRSERHAARAIVLTPKGREAEVGL